MKKCTKCGGVKPLDAFSPNRHMKSGRQSQCKSCCASLRRKPGGVLRLTDEQKLKNVREQQKRYHEKNRAARNAKSNARHATHREEENQRRREHYQANREHALAVAKAYIALNKKRKLAKQRATPSWADNAKINAIYEEAAFMRSLGVDVHVDHIVPLKGKNVSGLHTHNNLQLLLATDNLRKSNKMPLVSVSE